MSMLNHYSIKKPLQIAHGHNYMKEIESILYLLWAILVKLKHFILDTYFIDPEPSKLKGK